MSGRKASHQVGHRRLADVHLHVRIASQEGGQRLGHDAGEREGDADVQFAAHEILQLLKAQQTVVGRADGIFGQREQRLPGLGERHLAAIAEEERLVEFALEQQDLLRQGALGDEQVARGSREIQRLGHAEEVFQLP